MDANTQDSFPLYSRKAGVTLVMSIDPAWTTTRGQPVPDRLRLFISHVNGPGFSQHWIPMLTKPRPEVMMKTAEIPLVNGRMRLDRNLGKNIIAAFRDMELPLSLMPEAIEHIGTEIDLQKRKKFTRDLKKLGRKVRGDLAQNRPVLIGVLPKSSAAVMVLGRVAQAARKLRTV